MSGSKIGQSSSSLDTPACNWYVQVHERSIESDLLLLLLRGLLESGEP